MLILQPLPDHFKQLNNSLPALQLAQTFISKSQPTGHPQKLVALALSAAGISVVKQQTVLQLCSNRHWQLLQLSVRLMMLAGCLQLRPEAAACQIRGQLLALSCDGLRQSQA